MQVSENHGQSEILHDLPVQPGIVCNWTNEGLTENLFADKSDRLSELNFRISGTSFRDFRKDSTAKFRERHTKPSTAENDDRRTDRIYIRGGTNSKQKYITTPFPVYFPATVVIHNATQASTHVNFGQSDRFSVLVHTQLKWQ